jgi:hypothetical protein
MSTHTHMGTTVTRKKSGLVVTRVRVHNSERATIAHNTITGNYFFSLLFIFFPAPLAVPLILSTPRTHTLY